MPDKAKSRYETQNRAIFAVIEKYRIIRGIKKRDMGVVIGATYPTYLHRLQNADYFTLNDLRAIQRTLKIPPEELFPAIL